MTTTNKLWRKRPSVTREGKFFWCRDDAEYGIVHVLQSWHTGEWYVERNHRACGLGKFTTAEKAMKAADSHGEFPQRNFEAENLAYRQALGKTGHCA